MAGRTLLRAAALALAGAAGVTAGVSAGDLYEKDALESKAIAAALRLERDEKALRASYAETELRLANLRQARLPRLQALEEREAEVKAAEQRLERAVDDWHASLAELRQVDVETAETEAAAAEKMGTMEAARGAMEAVRAEAALAKTKAQAAREAFPLPVRWT